MNREILFKGKEVQNGNWIYGDLIHRDYGTAIGVVDSDGLHEVHVDEETICQYTGLVDKNRKKIWENDIIECEDDKHHFRIQTKIEWDVSCAGFIFQDTETSVVGLDAITAGGIHLKSKVIGNIFDNPELVRGEAK